MTIRDISSSPQQDEEHPQQELEDQTFVEMSVRPSPGTARPRSQSDDDLNDDKE